MAYKDGWMWKRFEGLPDAFDSGELKRVLRVTNKTLCNWRDRELFHTAKVAEQLENKRWWWKKDRLRLWLCAIGAIKNRGSRTVASNPPLQRQLEQETGFVFLYRGTGKSGLSDMRQSDDGVFGKGIYFYDNPRDAAAYSERDGGVIVAYADPDHITKHGHVYVAQTKRVITVIGVIPNHETRISEIDTRASEIIREAFPEIKVATNPPHPLQKDQYPSREEAVEMLQELK